MIWCHPPPLVHTRAHTHAHTHARACARTHGTHDIFLRCLSKIGSAAPQTWRSFCPYCSVCWTGPLTAVAKTLLSKGRRAPCGVLLIRALPHLNPPPPSQPSTPLHGLQSLHNPPQPSTTSQTLQNLQKPARRSTTFHSPPNPLQPPTASTTLHSPPQSPTAIHIPPHLSAALVDLL